MRIHNRTPQIQELRVFDRLSMRYTSIYIVANGFTDLDRDLIVRMQEIDSNIFEIESGTAPIEMITPAEPVSKIEEPLQALPLVETLPATDTPEEGDTLVESFICETCGGEFATHRSLARHINKVHRVEESES